MFQLAYRIKKSSEKLSDKSGNREVKKVPKKTAAVHDSKNKDVKKVRKVAAAESVLKTEAAESVLKAEAAEGVSEKTEPTAEQKSDQKVDS